jgi:predicted SAM-dependent methyltransferase
MNDADDDVQTGVVHSGKQLIKRRFSPSMWGALIAMREEVRTSTKHRGGVRRARAMEQRDLRLNLGCGPNPRPGWVNVDLETPGAVSLDLRRALPFATASCAVVYSEHFFEHLEYPEPARLHLREVFRVLQPGGTLSMGVPDAEDVVREYVTGEGSGFQRARDLHWHPEWCDTPMHQVNFSFRQNGQHRWAYDFKSLRRLLDAVGFASVRRRPFDETYDNAERRWGTLYVEATKP